MQYHKSLMEVCLTLSFSISNQFSLKKNTSEFLNQDRISFLITSLVHTYSWIYKGLEESKKRRYIPISSLRSYRSGNRYTATIQKAGAVYHCKRSRHSDWRNSVLLVHQLADWKRDKSEYPSPPQESRVSHLSPRERSLISTRPQPRRRCTLCFILTSTLCFSSLFLHCRHRRRRCRHCHKV